MYCPKCGKQQPSERNRFCTGCGLGLTYAANLLAAETGMAAVLQPLNRRTGEIIQSIGITERTTRQLGESNN